jgi:hypothetical protein
VPSRAWGSIFSRDQQWLNHSRGPHNISLSFWWPLWKINSFSLEAIWISHISLYWNSFSSLLWKKNLLTFCSHKTCNKSFAISIAYTGYDGCPSHDRCLQAKLIFALDLSNKHHPLSSSTSPLPLSSRTSFSTFLTDVSSFFIFSSPRNF